MHKHFGAKIAIAYDTIIRRVAKMSRATSRLSSYFFLSVYHSLALSVIFLCLSFPLPSLACNHRERQRASIIREAPELIRACSKRESVLGKKQS